MSHNVFHIDEKTLAILVPAFFGAMTGAITTKDAPTRTQKAIRWFSGFTMATFVGPAVVEWLNISTDNHSNSAAAIIFVVGMAGFSAIPVVINSTVNVIRNYIEVNNDKK